jgi:predicted phosphodiesterase
MQENINNHFAYEEGDTFKYNLKIPENLDYIIIVPLGDVHYGSFFHDEINFKRWLNWLYENKHAYVIGMGDLVEIGTQYSYGVFEQRMFANQQVKDMIEFLKPIAKEKRLLGLLEGNHEYRIWKKTGFDIVDFMCDTLNCHYYRRGAFLDFNLKKNGNKNKRNYTIYCLHGSSGAYTKGGKLNALMRLKNVIEADCYIMGHVHTLMHDSEPIYTPVRRNGKLSLEFKTRHYVISGSFLKYWGSYAQAKGYSPSGVGRSPKIKLHFDINRLSVTE